MISFFIYPKTDKIPVIRWCEENCFGNYFVIPSVRYNYPPGQTDYWVYADEYYFENTKDAMLFKLRWG